MSFNIFSNSLNELEDLAFSNPISMSNIINSILPEKEIFKKILADKIPGLSQEDIDLMSEAAFDNEEEDEDNEVDSEDEIEETKEEKKARKEREKEEKKAEKEQKKQQKEAEKEKRKEQKEANKEKEKEKEEREKKKQERKEKLKEEREKRKQELKKIYKEKWENFKTEIKELVNKIKTAIFQFFNRFLEVSKAFTLSLINVVTSLPGAVVMIVSPPWNVPFAVTVLLGVIISYLDLLSKIQSIVPFLQPLRLLPNVFTNDDLKNTGTTLNILTRSLIQFYGPILGLRNIIIKVIEFIKSLFSPSDRREKIFKQATKKLIKLGHIKSTRNRIVTVIEDDDAKLKIHPGGSVIPSGRRQTNLIERFDNDGSRFKIPSVDRNSDVPIRIYSWDPEDVEEVLSLLEQFKITNTKKWGGESHVSDYRSDINKVLNQVDELEKQLEEDSLIKKLKLEGIDTSEFDQFVYDITLPDGTIIPGVSEEGLEYYRKKFDLEIIRN